MGTYTCNSLPTYISLHYFWVTLIVEMITTALIEDDKLIGDVVDQFLQSQTDITVIGHYSSIEEFKTLDFKSITAPNIVLLDIVLPGISGIAGIKSIKEKWPETDIIMFSVMDDGESIFQSLCEGAVGYITKDLSMEDVKQALIDVSCGKGIMSPSIARKVAEHFHVKTKFDESLSPREKDIVQGITEGLSYKLLAFKLGISIDTVRKHIKSVYKKLQINSKAQLMSKYFSK